MVGGLVEHIQIKIGSPNGQTQRHIHLWVEGLVEHIQIYVSKKETHTHVVKRGLSIYIQICTHLYRDANAHRYRTRRTLTQTQVRVRVKVRVRVRVRVRVTLQRTLHSSIV